MKVLVIHNSYQLAGGEDAVFKNEVALLKEHGIAVETLLFSNNAISGLFAKLKAFIGVVFSPDGYKRTLTEIQNQQPDVVHVHNYFPLISPAIFFACKKAGVPVVHTLHNYRAICPTALLMLNGKIEERSIEQSPWWCVNQRVYKDSRVGTFVLALMVSWHKRVGTWQTKVDRFIALTQFATNKYEQAGWPEHKIVVKPNFIEDPFFNDFIYSNDSYVIFVGRVSEEKGIELVLEAWKNQSQKLYIVGDGPLREMVEQNTNPSVEYLGRKNKDEVLALVKNASALLMASTWYEGFPMVLVEAMACGTATIVPDLGGMGEIVKHGVTGLHFEPGSTEDLSIKVDQLFNSPEEQKRMALNARNEYLAKYTPEKNYEMLMDIYQQAIEEVRRK